MNFDDRSELLERLPVGGVGHVVHLHQFAALAGLGTVLPAARPFGEAAPSPGLHAAFAEGRGADRAGPERALDDPPDRGHAQLPALACQHGLDARLAHERVLATHVQDCLDVPRLPGALPHAAGTRRLRRQPALAAGGQRGLPPVQRAPADPDMRQRTRLVAAGVPQTAIRVNVRYRSAASGDTCSSTLKLRYDRMRMDFMFMGRVSIPVGLVVHWRLPDPAPRSAFSRRGVALPGHRSGARCVELEHTPVSFPSTPGMRTHATSAPITPPFAGTRERWRRRLARSGWSGCVRSSTASTGDVLSSPNRHRHSIRDAC